MMPFPKSARFLLLLVAVAAAFAGCGSERVAGGTTGAEAGNAITARLVSGDGRPVAGAVAELRSADVLTDSVVAVAVTDGEGTVRFEVDSDRAWVVVFRSESLVATVSIPAGRPSTAPAQVVLARPGGLLGRYTPLSPGSRISIAGTALWRTTDSNGVFRFDSLPAGVVSLVAGKESWTVRIEPRAVRRISLDASREGEFLPDTARPVIWAWMLDPTLPEGGMVALDVPVAGLGGFPWDSLLLVDRHGSVLPSLADPRDTVSGTTRVWVRPPTGSSYLLASLDRGVPEEDFFGSDPSLLWSFDSLPSTGIVRDLSRGWTGSVDPSASRVPGTSGLGGGLTSPYGNDLLRLDSTLDTAQLFAVSLRFRPVDPTFGRQWILRLDDVTGGGSLRLGWGGDSLVLEGPSGSRVSVAAAYRSQERTLVLARESGAWRVSIAGESMLSLPGPASRSARVGVVVGAGGGIVVSELGVWRRAFGLADQAMSGGRARARILPALVP